MKRQFRVQICTSPNILTLHRLQGSDYATYKAPAQRHRWKNSILKSISIIDAVLSTASRNYQLDDFEAEVSSFLNEDPFEEYHQPFNSQNHESDRLAIVLRPSEAAARLEKLLRRQLPAFQEHSSTTFDLGRRPSLVVRYWLPATAFLVRSCTAKKDAISTNYTRSLPAHCFAIWPTAVPQS